MHHSRFGLGTIFSIRLDGVVGSAALHPFYFGEACLLLLCVVATGVLHSLFNLFFGQCLSFKFTIDFSFNLNDLVSGLP